MTVVEKIFAHLDRYQGASDTLRTWLNKIGVTIPDGSRIDDLAALAATVEAGGGELPDIINGNYLFFNAARWDIKDSLIPALKKVETAQYMLAGLTPENAPGFDLSEFGYEHIYDATYMFNNNKALTSIANLSFPACIYAVNMFNGCTGLVGSVDASSLFLPENNVAVMGLFYGATGITHLKFAGKVSTIGSLCYNCAALETVDFDGLDTSACTSASSAFRGCTSLRSIDLTNVDLSSATTCAQMFYGDTALEEIIGFAAPKSDPSNVFPNGSAGAPAALKRLVFKAVDNAVKANFNLRYCSFERSGMVEMFESLPDLSANDYISTITITGNPCATGTLADGTACEVLTAEDKAIATAKGWTLAY